MSSVGLGWIFERGSIGSTSCSQPSWHVQPFWGCLGTILGALGLGILLGNLGLQCIIFFLDLCGHSGLFVFLGISALFWRLTASAFFLEISAFGASGFFVAFFGSWSSWRSFWTLDLFGALGTFLEALGLGILLGNLSFRGRRLLCSLSLDFGLLRGHFWHFFRGSRPRHSFWGPDLSLRASL